jgi:hypothetical protein
MIGGRSGQTSGPWRVWAAGAVGGVRVRGALFPALWEHCQRRRRSPLTAAGAVALRV